MKALFNQIMAPFGRCPSCMRTSFVAAVAAGTVSIGVACIYGASSVAATASMILASALGALWVTHMLAFAWRWTVASDTQERPAASGSVSRRAAMERFSRSLAFIVLATSLPTARAMAAQTCADCLKTQGNCLSGCAKLGIMERMACQKDCATRFPCEQGKNCD